jgi:hypothetical protein
MERHNSAADDLPNKKANYRPYNIMVLRFRCFSYCFSTLASLLLELSWLDKLSTMHLVSSPGGSEYWFLQL